MEARILWNVLVLPLIAAVVAFWFQRIERRRQPWLAALIALLVFEAIGWLNIHASPMLYGL
jgi:hypothetical protein